MRVTTGNLHDTKARDYAFPLPKKNPGATPATPPDLDDETNDQVMANLVASVTVSTVV